MMNRFITGVLVAGLGLTALSSGARAGANANAKIILHLAPTTTRNECSIRGRPPCSQVVTAGSLYPTSYYSYLIVADGNAAAGVGGVQCGIHYDGAAHSGVDVFSWHLCAALDFIYPDPGHLWPADGGGIILTWDPINDCQRYEPAGPGTGVCATAGYFYMTAFTPDRLEVIPRPFGNQAVVADCNSELDVIAGTGGPPGSIPSHLGYANFTAGGTNPGWNPCYQIVDPVQPTTWSGIKGNYR